MQKTFKKMFRTFKSAKAEPASAEGLSAFDGRVPAPVYVTLETTRYCNLKCRMCLPYLNGITTTGPHMPMEVFKELANELFPFAEKFQPSVSGEPMMSKGIMEMLRTADSYGVKVEMCTNGTLMSQPRIDAVIRTMGKVKISFDGATKETFEAIREGAKFERVVRNVKNLVASANGLPQGQRPHISLACTLMERNIRELPELVRLAHELKVDILGVNHVYPEGERMEQQSLVHHQELGKQYIQEAVAEARRLGQPFVIHPLDQITVAVALGGSSGRKVPLKHGVVEGFEQIEVNTVTKPFPQLDPAQQDYAEIESRRIEGRRKFWFQPPAPPSKDPPDQGSVWVCDFLWNRTWVQWDRAVKPCCISGSPVVGYVGDGKSFSDVWNNRVMRAMRQRLAIKDPVPVCKGCKLIREISDPAEVHAWLGGRRLPTRDEIEDLPELLEEQHVGKPLDRDLITRSLENDRPDPAGRPLQAEPEWPEFPKDRRPALLQSAEAPELTWPGPQDGRYVIEFSPDGFRTVTFATDPELPLHERAFPIPQEIWDNAPVGQEVEWRVMLAGRQAGRVIWRGALAKTS